MNFQISLTDITAIFGLIFGVSGLVLSISNYFRDRAKLNVRLQWDMTLSTTDEKVGVITVSNVGRRPVYISHAALKLPKECDNTHLLIGGSIYGEKLSEGDSPKVYIVAYDGELTKYAKYWRQIRAQISDSTSKEWFSKRNGIKRKPSWAGKED